MINFTFTKAPLEGTSGMESNRMQGLCMKEAGQSLEFCAILKSWPRPPSWFADRFNSRVLL